MKEYIISTIQKTFEVIEDVAEVLYQELILCTRNKNLVLEIIHINKTHNVICFCLADNSF